MSQYLTFDEYQVLGGTLDEAPFNLLEFEARKNIDNRTMGRLKHLENQTEEVKRCIFQLIPLIQSYEKTSTSNKGIASESIDGYSVTYASNGENITKAKIKDIKSVIEEYLGDSKLPNGIPYLYRG